MALYEYKCQCGTMFEVIQKMDADPFFECPDCHQKAPRINSVSSFKIINSPSTIKD